MKQIIKEIILMIKPTNNNNESDNSIDNPTNNNYSK